MRVDELGTRAEQKRWRIGYLTPGKIARTSNKRCHTCTHGRTTPTNTFRCLLIAAAVARNGSCAKWRIQGE